jgi:hypothetical protein
MFAKPYEPYSVRIQIKEKRHHFSSLTSTAQSRIIRERLRAKERTGIHIGRRVNLGIINQKYNIPDPKESIWGHDQYGSWQKKTIDYETAIKMINEGLLKVRIEASDAPAAAA